MKIPYIAGEWKVLFKPEKTGNYINDHTLFRAHDGNYHLFGITSFAGGAPNERYFAHGVTKDLNKVKDAYKTAGNENAFEFVHYPKYQDPQTHKYDDATSPPECVGDEEYSSYANADTKSHYFKKDVAIPWAIKHFKK